MTTLEEIEAVVDLEFHPGLDRDDIVQNDRSEWSLEVGDSNFEGGCP